MRVLFLVPPLLSVAACDSAADAVGGGGGPPEPRVVRDLPLRDFTAVAASGSEDVDIRVGPAFAVRVDMPQAVFDHLDIRVENGTLKIEHKRDSWSWSDQGARAKISVIMPAIDGAILAGSGNMTVDRAASDHFEGSVGGSGDLTIGSIETARLEFNVAGSGNLTAKGRAGRAQYSVAGSGDIDARALDTDALSVSVAGSGNIDARAKSPVKVSIVGSGDVTVSGAPCEVTKVGSGAAKCG